MMSEINTSANANSESTKQQRKMKVRIRGTQRGEKQRTVQIELEMQPLSLTAVKQEIIRRLQPSWDGKLVTLQLDNVKVFRVHEGR